MFTCITLLVDGNEYSSGFVMAITEFRISGFNGVAVLEPTVKFDVVVTTVVGITGIEPVVDISTLSIGTPFILSLKLYIYIIFFKVKANTFFFLFFFFFALYEKFNLNQRKKNMFQLNQITP